VVYWADQSRLRIKREPSWLAESCLKLAGYPDWSFLWFSSVTQIPGYNLKNGHGPPTLIMEAFASIKHGSLRPAFPKHGSPQPKWRPLPKSQSPTAIPSLWVQLLDIHPPKVLFVKDKLPDGLIFPPVTITPSHSAQPKQQTIQRKHAPNKCR
jgi:hypothetical protein